MRRRVQGHWAQPLIADVEGLACPCVSTQLSVAVLLAAVGGLGDGAEHNPMYHLEPLGQGWSVTVKELKVL